MTSSAYLIGCALATLAPLLSHARQIKFAAVAAHIASIAHSSALCRSQQKVAPLHLTDVAAVPTLPLLHFLAANARITLSALLSCNTAAGRDGATATRTCCPECTIISVHLQCTHCACYLHLSLVTCNAYLAHAIARKRSADASGA